MGKIRTSFAVAAAVMGVLELLIGLGSMIAAFVHSSKTHGELYAKFYSSSPVNIETEKASPYWWGGIPFLLPGICGLAVVFARTPATMALFIISNIGCMFVSIALAIIVGIFIGIWNILDDAFTGGDCSYTYDQTFNRFYCLCTIKEVNKFDADRVRVFVDSCDDINAIKVVLITIIALSCVNAVLCIATSVMGCISLAQQESPYKKKNNKQIQQQYLLQQQQAMSQARAAPQPTFQPAPAAPPPSAAANIAYQPPPYNPPPQTLGQNEPSMML